MKVDKFRTVIIYIIIILLGLVCLLPLLNIVAISFSSSAAVEGNMVGLIPVGFSTAAYKKILEDSQFWHSFLISVERVVLTLIINFVLIVLMAYPLSKTNAQFRGRNIYANLMIFAMLFNGGMIPTFLLVKSYGLLNTVWALVLPGAVPIFNVILVMNFFAAVPKELEEAAFIDGANPLQVLTKIFIPISKPVLATVSSSGPSSAAATSRPNLPLALARAATATRPRPTLKRWLPNTARPTFPWTWCTWTSTTWTTTRTSPSTRRSSPIFPALYPR